MGGARGAIIVLQLIGGWGEGSYQCTTISLLMHSLKTYDEMRLNVQNGFIF